MIHSKLQLDLVEQVELSYLGVAMAQMDWIQLFSECKPFIEGVEQGKGQVSKMDNLSLDSYDHIIMYRRSNQTTTSVVPLSNFSLLQSFVAIMMTKLYEMGAIK